MDCLPAQVQLVHSQSTVYRQVIITAIQEIQHYLTGKSKCLRTSSCNINFLFLFFPRQHSLSSSSHHLPVNKTNSDLSSLDGSSHSPLTKCSTLSQQGLISLLGNENNNLPKFLQHERSASHQPPPSSLENLQLLGLMPPKEKDLPTPTSTPTTARKSRRRSNLFIPSSKKEDKLKNSELGSGRSIPLKQGYLYKRSSKSLNKEWKKKYVTLCDDGKMTYHPSLHDYMDDVHGKEISLQYVTVKVPGQKPRGSKSIITNSALTKHQNKNGVNNNNNNTSSITEGIGVLSLLKDRKSSDRVLLTAYDNLKEPGKASSQSGDESGIALSNSNSQSFIGSDGNNKIDSQTPNVKKRHRRMKSSGVKNDQEDPDMFEFYIVSLDNKQWHFEANDAEERDCWVSIIEQEIFKSLQGNESLKPKTQNSGDVAQLMQQIRTQVPGNSFCVDCDSPSE